MKETPVLHQLSQWYCSFIYKVVHSKYRSLTWTLKRRFQSSQPFIPGVSERTMVGTTSKGGTSAFKGIGKKGGVHMCTPAPPPKKNNWRNKKSLTFERKLLLPAIFGVHVGIQGCRWIPQSLHILRPYDSWSEIFKQLVLYVNININITRDNHIPTS